VSTLARFAGHGNRTISFILGGAVLSIWTASLIWSTDASQIGRWTLDVLGIGFIVLLVGLIIISVFSLVRLSGAETQDHRSRFWLEVGLQAAGGVATLALTFTLLGISLGIGGLAGQPLTPETVQPIIRDLTANFSLAFMTTVIGLPIAAALRALLLVANEKRLSERRTL